MFAVTMIVGTLAAGSLADRRDPLGLIALPLVALGAGLAVLAIVATPSGWVAALGLLGLGMGASVTLWGAVLPRLYGTAHLGAIRGLVMPITVVATALGPGLTGLAIDAGLAYTAQAGLLAAFCMLLALLAGVTARRMRHDTAPGNAIPPGRRRPGS